MRELRAAAPRAEWCEMMARPSSRDSALASGGRALPKRLLGAVSEPSRSPLGTLSEPSRNPLGTASGLPRDCLGAFSEPFASFRRPALRVDRRRLHRPDVPLRRHHLLWHPRRRLLVTVGAFSEPSRNLPCRHPRRRLLVAAAARWRRDHRTQRENTAP